MTQTHHHNSPSTVVEDRSPVAAALIVLGIVVLAVFLVWLFAFSGALDSEPDTIIGPQQNTDTTDTTDSGGTTGGTSGDTGAETGTSGETGTTTGSSP